jgi:branched-chain amino acid transport system permease protein
MNSDIALILAQDGIVTGAIYALLGLAVVLVFTVTRVLFLPQGDLVAYAALTLAGIQAGRPPGTVWLTLLLGCVAAVMGGVACVRRRMWRRAGATVLVCAGGPAVVAALTLWLARGQPGMAVSIVLTLLIVVPIGPLLYRIAFQPVADAGLLKLMFIGVAVHFVLIGTGLLMFGPEGVRVAPLSTAQWTVGPLMVSGQAVAVVGCSVLLIALLFLGFGFTLPGKMLRATAVNRTGARVVGIAPARAGQMCFTLAALIGAASGILIAPVTPIFYDSGFVIGLKGFVASVVGGMVSYPLAAAGALLIGVSESFVAFWYSGYKDVLVFALVIPVLILRSLSLGLRSDEDA